VRAMNQPQASDKYGAASKVITGRAEPKPLKTYPSATSSTINPT
jgi:hypothetical protein